MNELATNEPATSETVKRSRIALHLSWLAVRARDAVKGLTWDLVAEQSVRSEAVRYLQGLGRSEAASKVHHLPCGKVGKGLQLLANIEALVIQ